MLTTVMRKDERFNIKPKLAVEEDVKTIKVSKVDKEPIDYRKPRKKSTKKKK